MSANIDRKRPDLLGATMLGVALAPRAGVAAARDESVTSAINGGSPAGTLLDALRLKKVIVADFDWGARTANIMAALWPQRCNGLVSVSGYLIGSGARRSFSGLRRRWTIPVKSRSRFTTIGGGLAWPKVRPFRCDREQTGRAPQHQCADHHDGR
jgi:pimeloyl-ACP methyl ester carboxylesterase